MRAALLAAPLAACVANAAPGRTLEVGPGKPFAAPSAAIAAAQDGDTVLIDPGTYFDCAVVVPNRLTIAGSAPGAVLTDKPCQGKALLVVAGDHVTIRDLTLARVRVPDGNGAGIRAEAPSITVQRVTFDNDQVGLLSGFGGGEIRIEDSIFRRGGTNGEQPLFTIMAANSALLRVSGSTFEGVDGGQISSAADRTEVVDNTFGLGTGESPGPALRATAGQITVTGNTITVGPNRPPRHAAIEFWDGASGTLRQNRLDNRSGQPMLLLLDWSSGSPTLDDNTLGRSDDDVSTSGIWRHRASSEFRARKEQARHLAGQLKRFVKEHAHW